MMISAIFLFASVTANAPVKYEDDLLCAAAMHVTIYSPKTIPGTDEDTIKAAQFGRQFYFGRLTAQDENIDWPAAVAERAKTLNAIDALNLVVPCLGRKTQLMIGHAHANGG